MEIRGTVYRILPQAAVTLGDGTTRIKGGFVIMREGDCLKPMAFFLNRIRDAQKGCTSKL